MLLTDADLDGNLNHVVTVWRVANHWGSTHPEHEVRAENRLTSAAACCWGGALLVAASLAALIWWLFRK